MASKQARLIRRGDIVKVSMTEGTEQVEEVVRDVSVILHMANGQDLRFPAAEGIEIVPPEEVPAGDTLDETQ